MTRQKSKKASVGGAPDPDKSAPKSTPNNPHDKNAIKLLYNGQKIGYIAKKDNMAFVNCLKLDRKIYGVITEITGENGEPKFEYETWFESR